MCDGMVDFKEFFLTEGEGVRPKRRCTRRSSSPMVREVQVRLLMRLRSLSREEALSVVRKKRR